MVEKFPTEQQVADALYECSGDIFNMVDVLRFLNNNDLNKDNAIRFICYLIGLKIMPVERPNWIPTILKIGNYYNSVISRYFEDCFNEPLFAVKEEAAKNIEKVVHEKFEWCMGFGYQLKIEPFYIKDAELRVKRMFAVYTLEVPNFEYLPEYSLFAYASYLISLLFAIKAGLHPYFAEAVGYRIFLALVKINKHNRQLLEMKYTEDHFNKFDDLFTYFAKDTKKKMEEAKIDYHRLIWHWENTLYTDEHMPINLLLIWDHMFFHVDEFQFFMRFLHVSHLRQMEKAGINFASKESMESMPWNAVELMKDCDDIMEQDVGRVKFNYWTLCPCYNLCPSLRKFKRF
ncbi:hypothetical protein TRFO_41373 [Tritrichomonas foetus]|uniref:Uncharacterized protein n=1 Tax=Tritrichomonas foetus TaxID=1144522 RepID=A0A1J4L4T7_9EUKA|nr:hypothetical protein TRFO_41373 [Tritrichomonas foetus]|eukprot:OHT16996.1 hypothetical protein TRFO_41373 [Tritrichomonas foetus]